MGARGAPTTPSTSRRTPRSWGSTSVTVASPRRGGTSRCACRAMPPPGNRPGRRDRRRPAATRDEGLPRAGTWDGGGPGPLEALALPVPAARTRPEARARDPPRGLAARDRRAAPGGVPARALPLRREPDEHLGATGGGGGPEEVRLSAMGVREPLGGHPRPLLVGPGPVRRRLAAAAKHGGGRVQ